MRRNHRKDRIIRRVLHKKMMKDYSSTLRLKEYPSVFTKRYELLRLDFMVWNLSWIYDKCKVVTGMHQRFCVTPYLLDLTTDSVTLYRVSVVANRNHNNPVPIKFIMAYNHFHSLARVTPASFENMINFRFTFYYFFLRKASSHHIR